MSMTAAFHQHPHWPAVAKAVELIHQAGFEALLAGGCVRDLIMNRVPNDFDIATNATPAQLAPLFPRALEVGREFGVTIVPEDGFQLEIATFRKDGPYLDGRRPSSIEFSTSRDDAARRDFTVNALFYDLKQDRVLDFVGGRDDIKAKVIRTVGVADHRFEEDKLRLLRAVRFAAQLDFEIAPETFAAIERLHSTLDVVSRERVRDELIKLMKSAGRVRGLELLFQTKMLWTLFPSFSKDPLDQAAVVAAWTKTEDPLILWCSLLKCCFNSGVELKKIMKQLTFPLRQMTAVTWVFQNSAGLADARTLALPKLIRQLASEFAPAAIGYHEAMVGPLLKQDISYLAQVRETYLVNGSELPQAWVNGADLQALGIKPGPEMGRILEQAYDDQLVQKFSSRDDLIKSLKAGVEWP